MRTSEKSATIAAALYAVHRDLANPRKDSTAKIETKQGRNYSYEYLSLPALIDHAKKALKDASVAVIQEVTGGIGWIEVNTRFMHLTGEWIEVGPIFMPATGDAQAVGSAITYARRYALAAALNLAADEDDDAASATSSPPQANKASTPSSSGRDGEAERGMGKPVVQGEGANGSPDPQPAVDPRDPHPGKNHVLKPSRQPNVPAGVTYCIIAGCDYVFWPQGTKEAMNA